MGVSDEDTAPEDDNIEIGEDGKVRLKKGKKIDLSKLSDDMLKKLGIDPNLTAKEKAKLLKVTPREVLCKAMAARAVQNSWARVVGLQIN